MTKQNTVKDYRKLTVWLLLGATLVIGSMLIGQQPSQAADIVVYKSIILLIILVSTLTATVTTAHSPPKGARVYFIGLEG